MLYTKISTLWLSSSVDGIDSVRRSGCRWSSLYSFPYLENHQQDVSILSHRYYIPYKQRSSILSSGINEYYFPWLLRHQRIRQKCPDESHCAGSAIEAENYPQFSFS